MTPANEAWLRTIVDVVYDGIEVHQLGRAHEPRDRTTREVLSHTVCVPLESPVVTVAARMKPSCYRYMFAEAASILQGDNRASLISPFAKAAAGFSDDGFTLNGHYGVKYVEQVSWVAQALASDHATRQAVMNIWRERPGATKDVPCTLSLQWLIRDGTIHCVSTMRSSDVWLGLPYDLHTFSAMTAHLALVLREHHGVEVELGWLWNTAGSRHLYSKDVEAAIACLQPAEPLFDYAPLDLSEFTCPDHFVGHLWWLTRDAEGDGWLTEAFR